MRINCDPVAIIGSAPDSSWSKSGGLSGGGDALAEPGKRYVNHVKKWEEGEETGWTDGKDKQERRVIGRSENRTSPVFANLSPEI